MCRFKTMFFLYNEALVSEKKYVLVENDHIHPAVLYAMWNPEKALVLRG